MGGQDGPENMPLKHTERRRLSNSWNLFAQPPPIVGPSPAQRAQMQQQQQQQGPPVVLRRPAPTQPVPVGPRVSLALTPSGTVGCLCSS